MISADHGCLQRRRSSPLGGFKPAHAGRTTGEVNIPHFPPCSASFALQMLRCVPGGGSVKVTFAFLAKLTLPLPSSPNRTPVDREATFCCRLQPDPLGRPSPPSIRQRVFRPQSVSGACLLQQGIRNLKQSGTSQATESAVEGL